MKAVLRMELTVVRRSRIKCLERIFRRTPCTRQGTASSALLRTQKNRRGSVYPSHGNWIPPRGTQEGEPPRLNGKQRWGQAAVRCITPFALLFTHRPHFQIPVRVYSLSNAVARIPPFNESTRKKGARSHEESDPGPITTKEILARPARNVPLTMPHHR
jgi:hypothetical protein